MATSYLEKKALFSVSKATFHGNSSLSLPVSAIGSISRYCFSSASNYNQQDRNTGEDKDAFTEASDVAADTSERAKETMKEGTERAKETAKAVMDSTGEAAQEMKEKSKEGTEKAAKTAQRLGEKARQTVEGVWGETKETGQKIKETVVGEDKDGHANFSIDGEEIEDLRRRAGGYDKNKTD